jgi:aldehyde dehydrogenase (NAD+)
MLEAWTADIGSVKMEAKNALKNLKKWTAPERGPAVSPLGRMRVIREPLGCVLIISPWNYPVQLLLSPLVGAIAAGNCALLKPSEVTPHTSALLAKLVREYLDPDAIALVEGAVDETTALLEERWDHIFYTGNGRVARVVMAAAAKHLTPVTLELGGKSPCIVDRDVELPVAARRIAWGKFMNAGQTCIAPDYVLVHRDREEELVRELAKCVQEFYGPDPKASKDYARIVNARHHRRIARLLDDGEPAFGGEGDEQDRYIAPTVLRGVDAESAVMQEEIFGPVLPVLPVDNIDQAIDFVNGRDKPLALYLFTNDGDVEEAVLSRTSSGGACVNGTILHISDPKLPFGGVGESGQGAYHGRYSFETFSHRKSVLTRSLRFDPKMMYPPYPKLRTAIMKRLL